MHSSVRVCTPADKSKAQDPQRGCFNGAGTLLLLQGSHCAFNISTDIWRIIAQETQMKPFQNEGHAADASALNKGTRQACGESEINQLWRKAY